MTLLSQDVFDNMQGAKGPPEMPLHRDTEFGLNPG